MRYSYFHLFRPQYFFQPECIEHDLFRTFYQPYTSIGEISWWLWKNFRIYRTSFAKKNIEKYVPEVHLRKILGSDSIIAINAGSRGPEQKITIVGLLRNTPFFLKYARTEAAISLVKNECNVLNALINEDFAPVLLDNMAGENFFYIKTTFLNGNRISDDVINCDILNLIRTISSLNVKGCKHAETNLETSFAHGDFCPWNLIHSTGRLMAYDWEMAGFYPLGYDLFTFVFQTSFLLHPKRHIEDIVMKNQEHFAYFFGNNNWKPYLRSFADIKLEMEIRKDNRRLIPHYKQLSIYDREA